MFRRNEDHRQQDLFHDLGGFSDKRRERLEQTWAGTFYREFFCRLNEETFEKLYADIPSRPNIPVNVLVGLEVMKAGFGWSDEEMFDELNYNLQVRYALGMRTMDACPLELRTVYNFRRRISRWMREHGENLMDQAFEEVTDAQSKEWQVKGSKLRMDSTQVTSNIQDLNRLQLLMEVIQRVHRMLDESERARYAELLNPFVNKTSGQYVYRLRREDHAEHLHRLGEVMAQMVNELHDRYAEDCTYQMLQRVFSEHFIIEAPTEQVPLSSSQDCPPSQVRLVEQTRADSLQSPDDWEATYRQTRKGVRKGYVVNVCETCTEDNPLQLIMDVQAESNTTDDGTMLQEALPELKARTGVDVMITDGGYNGPKTYDAMREAHVEHLPSAIRGSHAATKQMGLEQFAIQVDTHGVPQSLTCPLGQTAMVQPSKTTPNWFFAEFTAQGCQDCPLRASCPVRQSQWHPDPIMRFTQRNVDVAVRRVRSEREKTTGRNPRAAVEATVRSIKWPFGEQLPVRGRLRVWVLMLTRAAMINVRRIHRYTVSLCQQFDPTLSQAVQPAIQGA